MIRVTMLLVISLWLTSFANEKEEAYKFVKKIYGQKMYQVYLNTLIKI
jgi:hypothetical protein